MYSEYAATNVTLSEAEVETFATIEGVHPIHTITNSIQCAQMMFDTPNHSQQRHTIAVV